MNIVRVNMKDLSTSIEAFPDKYGLLGNRGLIAKIMLDEVRPTAEPLGRHNKLILCNGPLAGSLVSSASRLSVGGKSPLTGGIKESNSGGTVAFRLARQGIRAIIVEDKPAAAESLYILNISSGRAELLPGEEYKGLGTYATAQRLRKRFGKNVAIACIGQAGEYLMQSAGVFCTDKEGCPGRTAGRGGMGAVMGSKGIKAVVIDANNELKLKPVEPDRFRKAVKEYHKELLDKPGTGINFPTYGTAGLIPTISLMGAMPTHNFRQGSFSKADEISGEALRELILERGGEGEATHACMPGCIIRCSNIVADETGQVIVSPLEFETLAMVGSNLDIDSLDAIARINYACNDVGLDVIETGAVLGMVMEYGLLKFGDVDGVLELIDQVAKGTVLGRVIGQGAVVTGKVFGITRVPAVKGQSIAGHEPRGVKGMSVTYATTPMGADHTTGGMTRMQIDHQDPNLPMPISRDIQVRIAAIDTLGFCMFLTGGGPRIPDMVIEILSAMYGKECPEDFITSLGKQTIVDERKFNLMAGITAAEDKMPEFMEEEPLPPLNGVSDIPRSHYVEFWDESFWETRWDC